MNQNTNKKNGYTSKYKNYKLIKWVIGISSSFFIFMLLGVAILISAVAIKSHDDENQDVPDNNCDGATITFPESIENQRQYLEPSMEKYNIPMKYENKLLAQLYQESGGNEAVLNSDPWQSSESLCGTIGCITDPLESTEQAMKVHRANIDLAYSYGITDEDAILQAYNFGGGFLTWMDENSYTKYDEKITYEFSVKMTEENTTYASSCPVDPIKKKACYGDYKYVAHVQSKLDGTCGIITNGALTTLPMKHYIITQHFGATNDGSLGYNTHQGIDFDSLDGSPIYASGDGIVLYSGCNDTNCGSQMDGQAYGTGFGNMVVIDHGDGLWSIYAHMQEHPMVEIGDKVTAGEQIGKLGATGNVTGSHLHFEVHKNGEIIDPNTLLPIYDSAIADVS